MAKKIKNIILILIGIVIVFGMGYFVGKSLVPVVDIEKVKHDVTQEMIQGLGQKLTSKIEKGLLPTFARHEQIRSETGEIARTFLSGKVLEMDLQDNTLKVQIPNKYEGGNFFNYLNEPNYYIRVIKINEDTKIIEEGRKTVEQYEKEMREYERGGREGSVPKPYIETELSIEDLEEGLEATIYIESGFRLEEDKVIQAKKITIRK